MTDAILEVKGICKSYGAFQLDHVSFQLPKGAIMGLIGENGAGKSTTIKLILDLIRRDQGEILLFGQDNRKVELKQQIGVVFDENHFPEVMTPLQVGKMLEKIYSSWNGQQYQKLLSQFGLDGKKQIKDLSRGMKMKLSLAAAICHGAKLLILDEPTSGLDPVVRNEILDLFLEFIQDGERSILLSSHITSDLERAADYITFIHEGRVLLSGSKDDMLYGYGILKGGREQLSQVRKSDYLGLRTSDYGFEALVSDRQEVQRRYPELLVDRVTLEDIMLLMIKGK